VAAIKEQIARVLGPEGDWALVDNMSWTADLRVLDFLRDVGKHVTVNQMVARESVKARMDGEHGISYTEFSYMLLQANDYLWLHDHEACDLQIGGSDQWGNILSGVDLIRRVRGETAHALCWPLLTAPDGSKIGKTTGARVWLDADRTSPYAFYQHFMQVDDADVRRHLAWFTFLPVVEIDALVAEHAKAPAQRAAQRRLASEVTTLVHGAEAATAAEEASAVLFGGDVRAAGPAALEVVAREVPVAPAGGASQLVPLLVATGLASSNSDARRSLEQGAISLNGERLTGDRPIGPDDLLHGRWAVVRKGKKAYAVLDGKVAAGQVDTPGDAG
jgi:tyrosyl-tRNA synthetase